MAVDSARAASISPPASSHSLLLSSRSGVVSGSDSPAYDSDSSDAPARKNASRRLLVGSAIMLCLAAVILVVAIPSARSIIGLGRSSSEKAGGMSSSVEAAAGGGAPAAPPVVAAPVRNALTCSTVSTKCNGVRGMCSSTDRRCLDSILNITREGGSGVLPYDIYTAHDHIEKFWYPMHVNDLNDVDIQYMIHMYDLPGTDCPMPCFEEVLPRPTPPLCPASPPRPPPPNGPLDYNGVSWPALCFEGEEEEHVLIIGDWGGWKPGAPGDNTGHLAGNPRRDFTWDVDNKAQFLVARQLALRAKEVKPRYVLNVGDNFYWGGCNELCSSKTVAESIDVFKRVTHKDNQDFYIHNCSRQFYAIYETMYMGPGLDGIPWISCLGNHDYGGHHFHAAWDQQVAYTWGPSGRWVLPGLYYHQPVSYPSKGFSVDYYILDTNLADTHDPYDLQHLDNRHNICNEYHNIGSAAGGDPAYPKSDCSPFGPTDPASCVKWFQNLWDEQVPWLRGKLSESQADWQIIITHFPPETVVHQPNFVFDLRKLGAEFGVDLYISGHRHLQALYATGQNDFCPTADIPYVVSGGGGGITSEGVPGSARDGVTNSTTPPIAEYGFMDMTLSKTMLKILSFNHAGTLIDSMEAYPRARASV